MNSLLKVTDLKVEYKLPRQTVTALDGMSFEVPSKGYTVGLVGE